MEEIRMISKMKELTESASKLNLGATPVFNIEKKLKDIKTMMNKVCAIYMRKKEDLNNACIKHENLLLELDK